MPFWLTAGLVAGSVIAANVAANKIRDDFSFRRYMKQQKRLFNTVSEDEFERIVHLSAKGLPRIQSISTSLARVRVTMKTKSGLSNWDFTIDFNNNGKLTGYYTIDSDNDDSEIPRVLADRIQLELRRKL